MGALAFGYFIINAFKTRTNITGDVCNSLFGATAILTLKPTDVWVSAVMSAVVILLYVIFYNKIFAVTFDPDFMRATGEKSKVYEIFIAVVIAVVVSLSMRLVGSLLTSALIIFPALSAMRIFKTFKAVVLTSAVIAVVCAVLGLFAAVLWSTPVGATIVVVDTVVFGLFWLVGFILKRRVKA